MLPLIAADGLPSSVLVWLCSIADSPATDYPAHSLSNHARALACTSWSSVRAQHPIRQAAPFRLPKGSRLERARASQTV